MQESVYIVTRHNPDMRDHMVEIMGVFKGESEAQKRRQEITRHWIDKLADSSVRCLIDDTNFDKHCYHKFVIEVDDRNTLQQKLRADGITTKIHYDRPLHEEPRYINTPGPDMLSAASSLARRCLSLPIYPELTDSEVEHIAERVLSHVA